MNRAEDCKRHKELYAYRRANGLCYYCGKPTNCDRGSCQACRDKRKGQTPRTAGRRRAAAKLHICVSCLKAEAMPGRRLCGYCREYHDDATRRYRARARAAGKCHTCGARDPEPGYVRCQQCRERGVANKARFQARRKAA